MTSIFSNEVLKIKNALDHVFVKKSFGQNNANLNVVTDANGDITLEAKSSSSGGGGNVNVVDVVQDSNNNPVTSNAVFDEINDLKNTLRTLGVLNKQTALSINLPSNIVYGDNFNITGSLTLQNGEGISGQSVSLLVDDVVTDTTVTGVNGGFSFTESIVSMGNHTFKVIYNGSGDLYGTCVSSTLTRALNKETTVNTLNTDDDVYISEGDTVSVSGTLMDDDNTPISNASVIITDGTVTYATLVTNAQGAYAGVINGDLFKYDEVCVYAEYLGDSNYAASVSYSFIVNTDIEVPILLTVYSSMDYLSQSVNLVPVTGENIIVDWGDGTRSTITNTLTHTYAGNGYYSIKIYNVAEIGDNCFQYMEGLVDVKISTDITALGDYCFADTDITSIVCDGVTVLPDHCFDGCSSLTDFSNPANCTEWGDYCFQGTGLTYVIIPEDITSIGEGCFDDCSSLTSLTFEGQTPPSDNGMITYPDGLLEITVPLGCEMIYDMAGYGQYGTINDMM